MALTHVREQVTTLHAITVIEQDSAINYDLQYTQSALVDV